MTKLTAKNVKFTRSVGTNTYVPPYVPVIYTSSVLSHTFENTHGDSNRQSDGFGRGVNINDSYLTIIAPNEDIAGLNYGSVYIYDATTNTYLNRLDNPSTSGANEAFGDRSCMSNNNKLCVASYGYSTARGRVRVYDLSVGNGSLIHTIDSPQPTASGYFGITLGSNDNILVVGQPYNTGTHGRAFIFDMSTGSHIATLNEDANIPGTGASFGQNIAVGDDYIAVAAPHADINGTDDGRVFVYQATAPYTKLYTLDNPNKFSTPDADAFGSHSITINGKYLAVSAFNEDSAVEETTGVVYVYDLTDGSLLWSIDNPNIVPLNGSDSMGADYYMLTIAGDTLYMGVPGENVGGITDSGVVFSFDLTTGQLVETINNPAVSGQVNDSFGYTIKAYNDALYVAAPQTDSNGYQYSGIVYKYQLS